MATWIWLGLAVVLGVVEAMGPALVCIWFCLGAVASFIVSFFVDSIVVQIAVFVVASLVMLLALRPFMSKAVKAKAGEAVTNYDAYVGREVIVTQGIPAGQGNTGRVRLSDVSWLARTADGSEAPSGAHVVVKDVEGTMLVVEPAKA